VTPLGTPSQHLSLTGRLTRRLAGVAVLTVGAVAVLQTSAQAAPATGPHPGPAADATARAGAHGHALPQPMRGRAAVRALGGRLSEVAALNRRTPAELTEVLAEDPTMWLGQDGRLLVKEETATPPAASAASAVTATPAHPLDQTFRLHSLPGSHRTLLLDFDGVDVPSTSKWVTSGDYQLPAGSQAGWDPAGNGTAFEDRELAAVQEIWARVAEDYAPFDIDVTTQDPGQAALVRSSASDPDFGARVVVTDSAVAWNGLCRQQCGGIAWVGVTGLPASAGDYGIAWVFSGGTTDGPRYVAEAAAHEAGHTFGLLHDGNATSGYDSGHNGWAPIMGVGYDQDVTQWSKGDYSGANNQQDDVGVIARTAPLRADEAGGSVATAAALPSRTAYISSRSDTDYYGLGSCAGPVQVVASPAATGPDLDIVLTLVDATGRKVAGAAPPLSLPLVRVVDLWTGRASYQHQATGLGATVSTTLPEGTYYAVVDGGGAQAGGAGDPVTDYDDYGSLGAYTLSVTGCDAGYTPTRPAPLTTSTPAVTTAPGAPPVATPVRPSAPRVPAVRPGAKGGARTVVVRWRPPASTGSHPVVTYEVRIVRLVRGRARVVRLVALPTSRRSVEIRLPRRQGVAYAAAVRARSLGGWSALSTRSRAVRPR
jgi:hypothetical protein